MSTWYKLSKDCIELDGDEINILVNSDDSGNNYITVSVNDMKDILGEFPKVDVNDLHAHIVSELDDDTYDIEFTEKIATLYPRSEIDKVIKYCHKKSTQNKGRAFVKIFSKKMAGQL